MTETITSRVLADLQQQIDSYSPTVQQQDVGIVLEAGDGIARVSGLSEARNAELVQFVNGSLGTVFNLEEDNVGVIIMGDYEAIEEGSIVRSTGRIAEVPVGPSLMGRVVNALGQPIDGKGPIGSTETLPIERIAAGVVRRKDVDRPLETGVKSIDSMIPIGRGQRELIIGDRQTGKTAIAIDSMINQKGKDCICIYVAIGQKKAAIARAVATLEEHGAMEHSIVVVASADDPAAMQYIAPYAGCAMGEYFMENGQDALVVYDDLSKHAWAYRQVSLLLRRPPGREAYPGDVFYLHSRLLERAVQLCDEYVITESDASSTEKGVDGNIYAGPLAKEDAEQAIESMDNKDNLNLVKLSHSGGSLTALPIIETLLGDVSAYIPTNVISITDGQIYLENDLFYAGIRPAVNVGISVSRVGGAAQTKAMRQVAGRLRLDMASFRELAAFAQFGSDLDKATQAQLERGKRLQEILKQAQYEPMSLSDQVILIYAGVNGYADEIELERMQEWESALLRAMSTSHPHVANEILESGNITDSVEAELKSALDTFNKSWS
ncbi:MAG TPA: F0F1 ATP synthase subunit alpha [Chloroflexi bacterium]|nr:F0F1 ATP synthase subunit alpha [Chloroflexota bacterium]|tara:strand:+ start:598 stop:2250 length:1653 start_codon:yes stop_codon:yes gene_type:complete